MKYFKSILAVVGLLCSVVVVGGGEVQAFDRPCFATESIQTYKEGDSTPCSVDLNGIQRIQSIGGSPRQTTVTMGAAATANGTTAAFTIPTGDKSIYGQVVGTGAVTQTQAIYGDTDSDATNGILLCTITLSGTTRAQDACPVITANFLYYYVVTTNTTGTGATGGVYAMY